MSSGRWIGWRGIWTIFDAATIETPLLLRERQREGIALAKKAGVYKGRKPALDAEKLKALRSRVASGASKALVAREFGISRQTLYSSLQK